MSLVWITFAWVIGQSQAYSEIPEEEIVPIDCSCSYPDKDCRENKTCESEYGE